MDNFTTPFLKQYKEIKDRYQDCILFFRMGDFYELFMDDAFIGAEVLNITLTHKMAGKNKKVPMSGIPYHAVDTYLAKLVKAGYKVAICEQLSPPNKKGLVERDVIRVVTSGTIMDEKSLEKKSNNYLIALNINDKLISIAIADISTGYFAVSEKEVENINDYLINELAKISPAECLLPSNLYNDGNLLKILKKQNEMNIYEFKNWNYYEEQASENLKKHFKISTLASFGIENKYLAINTASILLAYLTETQKNNLVHIKKLISLEENRFMTLDRSTMLNLEIFSTLRDMNARGSLLSVIDETITAMGGRLLKSYLKNPLIEKDEIIKRQQAVEEFMKYFEVEKIKHILYEISDIERLISRLSVNVGNARDLINLKLGLIKIIELKKLIATFNSEILKESRTSINTSIEKVIKIIELNINDEPPIDLKNGGLIKNGVNSRLDELRDIILNSKEWIEKLEKEEKKKTGISSLKIKFNQVFGFYIEVSRSNLDQVPKHYMRKQTLVNGERFITIDLKKHEEIILTAQDEVFDLEYKIFLETINQILNFSEDIQKAAESVGIIDVLLNFSQISQKYNYVRPKIIYSGEIKIEKGRHPVVERLLKNDLDFIANDVELNNINQSLMIITGPNMAGKSVYIRQIALIVLMNQIGCFIPANSAYLSIVDRIFVRSGASDNITSGLSTFMVEMVETANILNNATSNSLIIMDEIGRGTSTYDGISIAKSVASYLANHFKSPPKTLFATHYHELQHLEEEYPNIKNYHLETTEDHGEPIFLHTLVPKGSSHSFGVMVARLAGLPDEVIKTANQTLEELENNSTSNTSVVAHEKSHENIIHKLLLKELENIDIAKMTPLDALNKLAEIKEKLNLVITSDEYKHIN